MTYNLKKEIKIYVVANGIQYNIDISDIDFSQNYKINETSNKTIQLQHLFFRSVLKEADPTKFSLTFPALRESDFVVLFNRALDYKEFDIYLETRESVFKIEKCVITNTVFNIEKMRPLSFSITGEGVRLTREGSAGVFVIPGNAKTRSSTRTYNTASYVTALIGGVTDFTPLVSVNVELQNDLIWIPATTISGCDDQTVSFPATYKIRKQVLAGSLRTYKVENPAWSTSTSLRIQAGQEVGNTVYGFDFDISSVAFTSRTNPENIYTQSYDWRMTQNPTSLLEVIKYITIPEGTAGAILDSDNLAILDSDNLPILESV
jgi:hypothetical protein